MKKELTAKEQLFCTYYSLCRNGREAAAKSGYRFPEKSSARLLKRKEILSKIKDTDERTKKKAADVQAGYYRLAFGCIADAVRLLFDDEITKQDLEQMDLFSISDIKRQKGGAIEIKFFDRLKALERLENLCLEGSDASASSLYSAIERSARALGENANE